MLNVLLVTLGLESLTELAGLSFALGASSPEWLIGRNRIRYQVEEDIKPFRDVLLGLFFVTVGMYLDVRVVAANIGWVLLMLAGPVLAKLVLIVLLARISARRSAPPLRTGFYLAQAGEFAIVLLAMAATWISSSRRWRSSSLRDGSVDASRAVPDPVWPSLSCGALRQRLARPGGRRSPGSPRGRLPARITSFICGFGAAARISRACFKREDPVHRARFRIRNA